tara:strand:+ start:34 stop:444 length:411 start_codon:yes stop_codon:yes gene_type:complete
MPKQKYTCPREGTIDVLIKHSSKVHLAHIYLETEKHEEFIKQFKVLFHTKSALTTATNKMISHQEEFVYMEDQFADMCQAMNILNNVAQDSKLKAWKKSAKKKKIILSTLDNLCTIINNVKSLKKQKLRHCKVGKK